MSIMFLLMITVKPTNSTSVVFPTSNAFKIKALAIIRSKDYKLKSNWISFRRIATKLAQNICDIMLDLLRQFLGFHCNCITC